MVRQTHGVNAIRRIAVIGAGAMGRQIALQIARHGFPVSLFDIDEIALQDAETEQRRLVAAWIDERMSTAPPTLN